MFADFPTWKGKKVLEIGCGLGTEAINFARHGADYTGTDLSIESLNLAQNRFKVYNQKGRFFQGNSENLSSFVNVEKYDLIYSFGVIHHSPKPNLIIDQIYKYMDDSTILKIMLYAKNSWKNYMIDAELDQPEANMVVRLQILILRMRLVIYYTDLKYFQLNRLIFSRIKLNHTNKVIT